MLPYSDWIENIHNGDNGWFSNPTADILAPGMRVTEHISNVPLFFRFLYDHRNPGCLLNITDIFDRCRHISAAVPSVKCERDSKTSKLTNGAKITFIYTLRAGSWTVNLDFAVISQAHRPIGLGLHHQGIPTASWKPLSLAQIILRKGISMNQVGRPLSVSS